MNTTTPSGATQVWAVHGRRIDLTKKICPKVDKFEKGYIYVAELSTAWVKIGRTADPVERMASMMRGVRSTGIAIHRMAVTKAHVNFLETEKLALAAFEGAERDGEFFSVTFEDACEVVASLKFQKKKTVERSRADKQRGDEAYNMFNTGFGSRAGTLK